MKKTDKRQLGFEFAFEKQVEEHLAAKADLLARLSAPPSKPSSSVESYEEACIEVAVAVKAAIRDYGKSREQIVDEINAYFGWKASKGNGGDKLSIHMFNHYLSKPAQYPIPAALLYAIHHLTGSLEPCRVLAAAVGGAVITREEKNDLLLGKMEKAVYELSRLKRQVRGRGR